MAISLHQVQKLTQRLAMTPLMQQALHLLQLPTAELEQMVLEEATQNPFLEVTGEIDDEELAPGDQESVSAGESEVSQEDVESQSNDEEGEKSVYSKEETAHFDDVDVEWESVYDDSYPIPSRSIVGCEGDEEERDLEDFVAAPQSLRDNLLFQVRLLPIGDKVRAIAEYIVQALDDDGYLRVPLDDIAKDLRVPTEEVEKALSYVQTLEPPGIGARSLAECLEIQLRHRRVDDPLAYRLVREHLKDVMNKNVKKIAKDLKIDEEKVRELIGLISDLEPSPGRAYSTEAPHYIRPDIIVKKIDDDYYIYVDDGILSGLRISPRYKRVAEEAEKLPREEDRKFVREKLKSAEWLIRNLERRKNTLLRVAQAILEHQRDFLDKGISHLKPLTLREVADVVGMHESTIARVTSGKYIETPRGTFDMKFFFSRGIQSDSGEDASNTTVKQLIADLIEKEDPSNPLSDQRIVEILKKKGINLARRTVAKYREQLGILPSRLRKKV